ncbi:PspC domain-containing protein [Propionicimonas sp.]|uniref:PspC domain-containing protein n=1 Tax=Propionicimonas sp. TaxID=1955623 RepID=UPI0039E570E2
MPSPDQLPVISRPRTGALAGGVCAGLARRWQLDPNLLRIAVVVLTFFGGLGLVAYAACLLLMPREGSTEVPLRRLLPFTRTWPNRTLVVVTIAAAVALVAAVGTQGIGLGPMVVIFCVWFFGIRGRNVHTAPPQRSEPTPFEREAEHWRQRLVEQDTPGYVEAAAPAAPLAAAGEQRWTQPYTEPASDLAVRDDDLPVKGSRPARRRWRLWWLALTLAGGAVLAVTVLGHLGLPATPLAYAAAVLAGFGVTLVVSTWTRRPPLLLPVTLLTAVATASMLVTSLGVRVPDAGERAYSFRSGADLPASIELQAGELTVDLSRLELASDQSLSVHVGAGQLNLVVPSGVTTQVDWTVKAGEYNATGTSVGESRGGFDLEGSTPYPAGGGGTHTLRVVAEVGLGELDVKR